MNEQVTLLNRCKATRQMLNSVFLLGRYITPVYNSVALLQ